jgi:hypothetical protein
MTTTRSGLKAASISSLDNSIKINCMFNPQDYTVKKSNRFRTDIDDQLRKPPKPEFKGYGRSELTLKQLVFDTYETGENLTDTTNKLWDLMRPTDPSSEDSTPPEVKFEWSTFFFQAFIQDMSISYTLFDKDGHPVRAEVTITFIESDDPTRHPHERQNPTSGGGEIQEIRQVTRGDRLDLIAANVYGDATKWRLIADHNGITNPRSLQPGQMIVIPPQ